MSEATLHGLASAVFGGRCNLGFVRVDLSDPSALLAEEYCAIRHAVPSRQREFAAGREAARRALNSPCPIPAGADRAPVWPRGWVGSITHSAGWAVAVAREGTGLLGVDLELDEELPAEILSEVLTPAENRRLGADLRGARRIFAIKEAVYKAQYPVSRQIFGFQTLDVTVTEGQFFASFAAPVDPFRKGDVISGHWGSGGGLILAGVCG